MGHETDKFLLSYQRYERALIGVGRFCGLGKVEKPGNHRRGRKVGSGEEGQENRNSLCAIQESTGLGVRSLSPFIMSCVALGNQRTFLSFSL